MNKRQPTYQIWTSQKYGEEMYVSWTQANIFYMSTTKTSMQHKDTIFIELHNFVKTNILQSCLSRLLFARCINFTFYPNATAKANFTPSFVQPTLQRHPSHLCSLMLEQWNAPEQNIRIRFPVTYLQYVSTNLHPGYFELCTRTTSVDYGDCSVLFCLHCLCASLANVCKRECSTEQQLEWSVNATHRRHNTKIWLCCCCFTGCIQLNGNGFASGYFRIWNETKIYHP